MLDVRKIRENPDLFRDNLARRNSGDEKLIAQVLVLDEQRRKHLQESEALKSERNKASKEIGAVKAKGGDITEVSAKMKTVGEQITRLDQELAKIEAEQSDLLLRIPNVNHDSVPVGKTAEDNRIERIMGQPAEFAFKPKPHWEIGTQLGLLDLDAATKISGSGFIVYKGQGARLQRALINFLLELHTSQHGYTEVSPPYLVRRESMVGTGQFPKFTDQQYEVVDDPPLYLIP